MWEVWKQRMKILIAHNYYQLSGGEDTVVQNEKTMLEEHGVKVFLYTRNNAELQTLSGWQKLMLPFATIFSWKTYREVKRIIRREKIDLVHVHNTLNLISPSVYYAAFRCHIPVVQTIHNFRFVCPEAMLYRDDRICEDCLVKGLLCSLKHSCYRGSKLQTLGSVLNLWIHRRLGTYRRISLINLTEFNAGKLLSLNANGKQYIDPQKMYIKPNFTYDVSDQYTRSDEGYYLFIGRLNPIKGLDLVLKAFRDLPSCRLKVVGTSEEEERYRKSVKECDNMEFLGYLKKDALGEVLSKARAVVIASQCYETFGMTIPEAYAMGVPVIAGDLGNSKDLVEDGITGFRFLYDSPESLREQIERFERLKDQDRRALGEAAYRKFCTEYSPESNFKKLEEIYQSVLAGN